MTRGWVGLTFLALLLAAPAVDAAEARLRSPESVWVDGQVTAATVGPGVLVVFSGEDVSVFRGVTGDLTVWTWETHLVESSGSPVKETQTEDATRKDVRLDDATLIFRPHQGAGIVVSGDALTATAAVATAGTRREVPQDREVVRVEQPSPYRTAPPFEWTLQKGWPYVGNLTLAGGAGWPLGGVSVGNATGTVALQLEDGDLTIVWPDGRTETFEVGVRNGTQTTVPMTSVASAVFVKGRAFANVTLAGAEIATGATWILAGPQIELQNHGTTRWTRASGEVHDGAETQRFTDATVTAVGAVQVIQETAPLATTVVTPTAYAVEGDAAFTVDGARVAAGEASTPGLRTVSLVAVLLAALALAAKFVLSAYTRIAVRDVLVHPMRQRIETLVRERPGIHSSELHRAAGSGWGAYAFHLRVLQRAGLVRLRRRGAFVHVYPADAPIAEVPDALSPATTRVLEAISREPMQVTSLSGTLGMSRQNLNYHLAKLEGAGLVLRAGSAEGTTVARRERGA